MLFRSLAEHIVEGVYEAYEWARNRAENAANAGEWREDYANVAIGLWAGYIGEHAGFETPNFTYGPNQTWFELVEHPSGPLRTTGPQEPRGVRLTVTGDEQEGEVDADEDGLDADGYPPDPDARRNVYVQMGDAFYDNNLAYS